MFANLRRTELTDYRIKLWVQKFSKGKLIHFHISMPFPSFNRNLKNTDNHNDNSSIVLIKNLIESVTQKI